MQHSPEVERIFKAQAMSEQTRETFASLKKLREALQVAKETIDGWTVHGEGLVTVHIDVINKAVAAAIYNADDLEHLEQRFRELRDKWDGQAGSTSTRIHWKEAKKECRDELAALLDEP